MATAAAIGGEWIDGHDIFTFTVGGSSASPTVPVVMTIKQAGAVAFTRADGAASLDADGVPVSIALTQSGKGVWVRHEGAFEKGGCEIVWTSTNTTQHHWAPFCKSGASCAQPPPVPPSPEHPACTKMKETGIWQPWVL